MKEESKISIEYIKGQENFLKAKKRADQVSNQLAWLRCHEHQMFYGKQKFLKNLPENDALKNLIEQTAEEAERSSIPLIEKTLTDIEEIKKYLLNRKEELKQDG